MNLEFNKKIMADFFSAASVALLLYIAAELWRPGIIVSTVPMALVVVLYVVFWALLVWFRAGQTHGEFRAFQVGQVLCLGAILLLLPGIALLWRLMAALAVIIILGISSFV